jgi:uncharacterized protein with ParB-like and HNH nuclease domain
MKGNVTRLVDVIDGKNKILEIPVYQRNYDWKQENIAKLFQDLVWVAQNDKPSHFFGSVVTKTEDGREVVIIDGQQRLTSVSLLLIALRQRYLDAGNQERADEIYETYLYNKFSSANDHYKLRPIKRDLDHYKRLFQTPENFARPSNITTNYEFFCQEMQTMPITNDQLLDAIEKLEVMELNLQADDDPQLIFESINSTGLDLTDADKVRNLLLMNESYDKQTEYFEKYWNPIERKSQYDVTPLIRYWLTNKLGRVTPNNRLYTEFKAYVTQYSDKEQLLQELLMYANNYEILLTANTSYPEIDAVLQRDQYLMITTQNTFYLGVLASVHQGELTMADFAAVVRVIENYLFRRAIVEAPTNALNKIFATLHREVMRRKTPGVAYTDILTAILLQKHESGRFPSDEEFVERISQREIYRLKSGVRSFLFERLENADNKEAVDVFTGLENKKLSIEHIMPQTMTAQWRRDLGTAADEIHQSLLHSLGNLTLTGYNSEMQNAPFRQKREYYLQSHLGMTREVSAQEVWGKDQINARTRQLAGRLVDIFAMPKTAYRDPKKEHNTESFDPDRDYTGMKLVGYQFQDGPFITDKVWKHMQINIVADLYAQYPEQINKLAVQEWTPHGSMLPKAFHASADDGYTRIADGIYLFTDNSTWNKMRMLYRLFEYFGVAYDDLEMEFSN